MSNAENTLQAAERVASIMLKLGVPAVVIGAVALAAHRYVRFTADIDLGVDADLDQMRKLLAALTDAGFKVEFHEPDSQDPLGGVLDVSGSFGLVQVVSFGGRFPAVIHDALTDNETRIRPGSELRLAPIAQLVALKLYAGGSGSKSDIIELLRRNPEVDLEVIRATCKGYRLRGLDAVLEEV